MLVEIDEIAVFHQPLADRAGDGRAHLGVFQPALRILAGQFELLQLVLRVVEDLFADEFLLEQRLFAFEIRAGFRQARLGLAIGRLLRVVVQPQQHLILLHDVALLHEQLRNAVGSAGEHLHILFRFEMGRVPKRRLDAPAGDRGDFHRHGVIFLGVFGVRRPRAAACHTNRECRRRQPASKVGTHRFRFPPIDTERRELAGT